MSVPTLSYDTPQGPTPTIWLHYVARTCGVLPLIVGTLVFFLSLVLRENHLAVLGLFTILGGTCLAFVGLVCALVFHFQAKRAAPDVRRRAQRLALIDGAIIMANFSVAVVMAMIGSAMMSHF